VFSISENPSFVINEWQNEEVRFLRRFAVKDGGESSEAGQDRG
jgi:hypothetical protein